MPVAKKAIVGSDHAAVSAKRLVIEALGSAGLLVEDVGPDNAEAVDYPDYAVRVASAVADGRADFGVLLCGSGIGMSIAANKIAGIRAALVHDVTGAKLSRQHNDANVLVLGGAMLGERLITEILDTWLNTDFAGGRHERRVEKIAELERDAHGSRRKQ